MAINKAIEKSYDIGFVIGEFNDFSAITTMLYCDLANTVILASRVARDKKARLIVAKAILIIEPDGSISSPCSPKNNKDSID
jgi:hypothetical protein